MICRLACISSSSVDPYSNIALEEYLLRHVADDQCILYLWQNQCTVVVGRNQNVADEVDVDALTADGGHVARRLSGGGAVYHDLGNLNFTFLVPSADFDVDTQTDTILAAVREVGIDATRTGRNDLTVDGRKFSGHAYYHSQGRSYHHGTLMVDVDEGALARYLTVNPHKLAAKGVHSVRSRVTNLRDHVPDLEVSELAAALRHAFGQTFGLPVETLDERSLDADEIARRCARFSSEEWLRLRPAALDLTRTSRFSWGTTRLDLTVRDGCILDAALWSDGLDADALEAAPRALVGCALVPDELEAALHEKAGMDTGSAHDLVRLAMDEATGQTSVNG
jgi:lipoate-protein ligase A